MIKIIFICFLMRQMDKLNKTIELNIQFLLLQKKTKKHQKISKKLWEKTGRQIEVINDDEPIKCRKDFMKIRFESDGDLPLGKTFNIDDIIIDATPVLEKDGRYYPQFFLHEYTYKL